MSSYNIPGVVKIQFTRCEYIQPHVMLSSICGAIIALALPATAVKFSGSPSLKWEGSLINGSRSESTTLEFSTSQIIPERSRIAFIVTLASGKQYLIGSREPKYPRITFTESAGTPDGDAALRRYKISHVALKSMLQCIL